MAEKQRKSKTVFFIWNPSTKKVWCDMGSGKWEWCNYKTMTKPHLYNRYRMAQTSAGRSKEYQVIKVTQTIMENK